MDIPNWGYAGTSDSQCVDANAGIDITELTLLSMQAGSNLNHDIGYLDFGLTGAGELVVLTDEVISMNRRALEGIEVNEETLGARHHRRGRPGRRLPAARSTPSVTCADLQWRPTILNRSTQKNWEAAGALDATEKAHLKLRGHHDEPQARAARRRAEEDDGRAGRRVRRGRQVARSRAKEPA